MILVNTDYVTGKELEMQGLVKGSTIQSKTSAAISHKVLRHLSGASSNHITI
jgi:uncharacterized protein YbjQ (UPF0145 family)